MIRTDVQRLEDAVDHARHAGHLLGNLTSEQLGKARATRQAIVFDVIVIGEALHQVSADVKRRSGDVPLSAIWSTRNRLVHGYWLIDPRFVHELVLLDLPALILVFEILLRQLKDGRL